MKLRLLILLAVALAPVAQAGSASGFCQSVYAKFSPKEAAKRAQIAQIETRIQEVRARYEAAAEHERMGGDPQTASLRQQLQDLWNQRAGAGKGYRVTPLEARFAGEQNGFHWQNFGVQRTRHFDEKIRAHFEVHVDKKSGDLLRSDGKPLNTCSPKPNAAGYDCRFAIFVMDADGRIFVYDGPELLKDGTHIHHSSFLSGLPVASAGQLQAINGRIHYLDPQSGHYLPARSFFRQVEAELEKRGVQLAGMRVVHEIP